MTAKEKSMELLDKYYYAKDEDGYHSMSKYRAKQCALIAVDEILNVLFQHHEIDYWQKVKNEINKL